MSSSKTSIDSLIDWSSPVLENPSSRPLIPLPAFVQIEITEDNPFDAVERQINENEVFDVLNMNLSFGNADSDDKNNSFDRKFLIEFDKNEEDVAANDVMTTEVPKCEGDGNEDDAILADKLLDCRLDSRHSENSPQLGLSVDNSLSEASDIKELISSRISKCITLALNDTNGRERKTPEKTLSLPSSKRNSLLNEAFMSSLSERKFERSRSVETVGSSLLDFEDDLQAIVPHWDETLSSDEECEKEAFSRSLPTNVPVKVCSKKPLLSIAMRKSKHMREPLVPQDPNIKARKNAPISTEGPLKAMVPLSHMKKITQQKAVAGKTGGDRKSITLIKSKATSSWDPMKSKRISRPAATSTPQNCKSHTSKSISRISVSNKLSISATIPSRHTSPDSTSSLKFSSRIGSSPRRSSKSCLNKSASNAISSSTPVNSKLVTTARATIKSIRNKENIIPFKF